jgi:hypothetical protein
MLAAEFPNDNPDLHEGTIWVCLEVTGAPVAERRPPPVRIVVIEPAPEPFVEAFVEPVIEPLVEPLIHPVIATLAEPILPSTLEPVAEPEAPVARESGIFMTFSSLREEEELDEEGEILVEEIGPLEDAILEVVAEAAPIVEPEPVVEQEPVVEPVSTIAPPPPDDPYVTFVSTVVEIAIAHGATAAAGELPSALDGDKVAQAWAGIIRGTSEDWDAVGGSMLDEWAADTLARVTGADAQMLKRELRARGIAAFGLAA